MTAFINGIGMISPQKSAETQDFLSEVMEYEAEYLKCIEPNYKDYINPLLARRMSRLIKMGITAAKLSLRDAGIEMPDAILTGTGLGSVEDTEQILSHIHDDSVLFNPTPFMQSTYNTISSQIAINLKCHGYNSTYTHRNFSFESGLIDALLQLEEKMAETVLAGGIDEMSMNHLTLIRRPGHWKRKPVNNRRLLEDRTAGAFAGEGAGYFTLSSNPSGNTYSRLVNVSTFYNPADINEVTLKIDSFLTASGLSTGQVDLFLTGVNGDTEFDFIYYNLAEKLFPQKGLAWFKHLCGEYNTSTAFALWVASNILKRKAVPPILILKAPVDEPVRNILIYNQYRNVHHSLMLVSAV